MTLLDFMKRIIQLSALLFLVSACTKNNPAPSWLEINPWQLIENPNEPPGTAGQLSSNFSDAWVYVDNELIGVFELPCKIPVMISGNSVVKVFPAVLNNGISATKKIYPFVEPYDITVDLVQNETTVINPITQYYVGLTYWIEDFEAAGHEIEDDPLSLASMSHVSGSVLAGEFNGDKFGRITLDETNNTYVGYSQSATGLNLPTGKDIYLEIDYHNTNRLTTGLLGISASSGATDNPNIQLNAQDDGEVVWKKIYIELREIVVGSPTADYFELSFSCLLDDGDVAGEINIDNIKVIHF